MKKITTFIFLILFGSAANAGWYSVLAYSKFEQKDVPLIEFNISVENKSVKLNLYRNRTNDKVLTLSGLPYDAKIGFQINELPNKEFEFKTPYRIKVGNDIYKLDGGIQLVEEGLLTQTLASESSNLNRSLISRIENAIKRKEDIAIEFPGFNYVFIFTGETISRIKSVR
jgi:hypothetical protein